MKKIVSIDVLAHFFCLGFIFQVSSFRLFEMLRIFNAVVDFLNVNNYCGSSDLSTRRKFRSVPIGDRSCSYK